MIITDGKKIVGIAYMVERKYVDTPTDWANEVMEMLAANPHFEGMRDVYEVEDTVAEVEYWENDAKEATEVFNTEKEEEGWELANGRWHPVCGGRYYEDEVPGRGYWIDYDVEDVADDFEAQVEKFREMGY